MTMVRIEIVDSETERNSAILHSSHYCFIILNGADERNFRLTYFCKVSMTQRVHALKLNMIVPVQHSIHNKLYLYKMMKDHSAGANNILEALQRFLNTKELTRL